MKYIIAIDVGGTNIKVACLTEKFVIKDKRIISTRSVLHRDGIIRTIVDAVGLIMEDNGLSRSSVLGVGVGLPGPVDNKTGFVHFLPNIPGFRNVNLKKILSSRLGLKVSVDNDAQLMCLAEHTLGAAQGLDYAVCITLGTGVGGGLILNGKLYRGAQNAAGEVGHIPINVSGPKCNCGGVACLEAYVGNKKILAEVRQRFGRHIPLEELSSLARRNNKKAAAVWKEVGNRIGVALSGLVNVLNLDAVVIGGGVADAGKILFDAIRSSIRRRAMPVQAAHVKVLKSKLGYDAGLIGAAVMVRETRCRRTKV